MIKKIIGPNALDICEKAIHGKQALQKVKQNVLENRF